MYLSQSPAEYGWTAGGAVSMATKSGTNQLHGEGFEFYRNKALNAIDPFAKAAGQREAELQPPSVRRRHRRPDHQGQASLLRGGGRPEEQPVRQRRRQDCRSSTEA